MTKTDIKKHSFSIHGHKTSITIENVFWDIFIDIAKDKNTTTTALLSHIDSNRIGNLSSAVRVYILEYVVNKTNKGHNNDDT